MFDQLTGEMEMWRYFAPKNNPPGVRRVESDIEEIEVIVAGHGDFRLGERVYDAGPGSVLWYCPGDDVRVVPSNEDPYETIVFRFRVSELISPRPTEFSHWRDLNQCVEFCREAFKLYQEYGLTDRQRVGCYYARLMWENLENQRRQARVEFPPHLRLAIEFIRMNYRRQISVAEIADQAGISSPHLRLLFRTHLSISPMQYVIRLRISAAQEILMKTNLSIKEICYEVGFNDVKYFCSRFKRQTSYRPGEYRRIFIE